MKHTHVPESDEAAAVAALLFEGGGGHLALLMFRLVDSGWSGWLEQLEIASQSVDYTARCTIARSFFKTGRSIICAVPHYGLNSTFGRLMGQGMTSTLNLVELVLSHNPLVLSACRRACTE